MHIFFNFSRKERIIAYYQPYTEANFFLPSFGRCVFSHDTMDKVGTNISVAYSSKSPCMRNKGSCGFFSLIIIIIAKKSFDLQSSCA